MRTNPKFLELKLNGRGFLVLTWLLCKDQRDDGRIFLRNFQHWGDEMGCDRKTAVKLAGEIQEKSFWVVTESESGVLQVDIANYKEWQEIDVKGVREKSRKNPTKIPPLRAEQSRAEQSIYIKVIEDLNQKAGTKYKWQSKQTQSAIKARLDEGFTLDNFCTVHTKKCNEWAGTDMAKYLRPETLYRPSKFESYLNQVDKPKQVDWKELPDDD